MTLQSGSRTNTETWPLSLKLTDPWLIAISLAFSAAIVTEIVRDTVEYQQPPVPRGQAQYRQPMPAAKTAKMTSTEIRAITSLRSVAFLVAVNISAR